MLRRHFQSIIKHIGEGLVTLSRAGREPLLPGESLLLRGEVEQVRDLRNLGARDEHREEILDQILEGASEGSDDGDEGSEVGRIGVDRGEDPDGVTDKGADERVGPGGVKPGRGCGGVAEGQLEGQPEWRSDALGWGGAARRDGRVGGWLGGGVVRVVRVVRVVNARALAARR